ncbi:MAG TPA: GNAT family N-acetyltransferase [Catenuloplanes sp.]
MRPADAGTFTVAAEPVDGPASGALLREYFTDIGSRHLGRAVTDAELDAALAEDSSDDLTPPRGMFLVLRRDGQPAGSVGLRHLAADIGEVKRLYVAPSARGRGAGRLLLAAVERHARGWGVRRLRLDTRADLIEARGLYRATGYAEIPAYNDGRYAECWYEKLLS